MRSWLLKVLFVRHISPIEFTEDNQIAIAAIFGSGDVGKAIKLKNIRKMTRITFSWFVEHHNILLEARQMYTERNTKFLATHTWNRTS